MTALSFCSLPFKGRARVGMGFVSIPPHNPIPHLTSPLKGEEHDGERNQ